MDIEIIEIAVNPDHVHIFFKYPPKYSLSFIRDHLWRRVVSTGLWGRDGMLWKNIFVSKIYMNIVERNKENDSYRPRTFVQGIP